MFNSVRSMSLGISERMFWSKIFRVGEFICFTNSGFLPEIRKGNVRGGRDIYAVRKVDPVKAKHTPSLFSPAMSPMALP